MITRINARPDREIGEISPRLYGHLAEHIGRCCYDGLWGGDGPLTDGFRADVVAALTELPTPLVRWPGGCYADHYHWRDGVGPGRTARLGISCGLQVTDENTLGTHEFLRLCELVGAEPYLAGNLATGSVQEFCDWVEYCNGSADSELTRQRRTNGRGEPWGIRLWGVGNESWDCGGRFEARAYADEFRRYASMIKQVDPRAELVAVGLDEEWFFSLGADRRWNEKVLEGVGWSLPLMDHLSVHRYLVRGGPELDFDERQYYELLAEADETEQLIERTAETIRRATGGRHQIGVALDEWGVWHAETRDWAPTPGVSRRTKVTYEQANTLRDALATGAMLEVFHRQCRVLSLANLSQVVNVLHAVLMTQGPISWRTPTYHALALHAPHIGAMAMGVDIQTDLRLPTGGLAVTATASAKSGGLAVTIINRHLQSGTEVEMSGAKADSIIGQLLASASPSDLNSATHPDRVAPVPLEFRRRDDLVSFVLPRHSMATIQFSRATPVG